MTTTSFTLRKTSVGYGSYLQNNGDDSALRSDQYIPLTAAVGDTNTFSANVITNDEVLLEWTLSFSLVTSSAEPAPIALAIVASPTGEPITVKDGVLVTKVTSNTVSSFTDTTKVREGRWVYYSLFVEYSDFGSPTPITWYERAASVYVQIPKAYGSVDNFWNRVPEYYRELDYKEDGNPLYNFLELFGWEVDRTRTLIETVALSNDPELAVTPALRELAYEVGLEVDIDVVGTTKTRTLMQNIGYLRRRKGTVESIIAYLAALTGSRVDYVNATVGASQSHIFNVHSQRVNFVKDPQFTQALGSPSGSSNTYYVSSSTYDVEMLGPSNTYTGASVSALSGGGLKIDLPPDGATNTRIRIRSLENMPYPAFASVYTAFEGTLTGAGASFNNVHLIYPTVVYDTWNTERSLLVTDPFNPSFTRAVIEPNSSDTTITLVRPALDFVLPPGGSLTLNKWLVELYSLGDYFDGNTREGGLIPGSSGYGTGSSDYRWAGTANSSFSYYMLDYKRVYDISQNIIKNYIAPVTMKDHITINWDYYLGKT